MSENDAHLGELIEFLRFPSVSTKSEHSGDMWDCAQWLCRKLGSIGLEAEVADTPGHPVVLASTPRNPAKKTVLIYGHYDVQPPEPLAEWTTPPFEPEIRDGKIFARGSSDNKGQIFAHILGVQEALQKHGELPVNVIFLIEGEEEIGSPNLPEFLRKHADWLACDVIAISDTGMAVHGYPTLSYALRGVAAMEIKVTGPSHDLHSGIYGGAVANPATVVARLLASLHESDGRVAINGFYDKVRPLEDWERVAAAEAPIREDDLVKETGVPELAGEKGYTALERIGARPTAEVNGIGGGYQGEGTKTVIAKEAFAKVTFRLVADQTPKEIQRIAADHFTRHCPPGVKLQVVSGHGGEPYYSDPNGPDGLAARRALEEVFGKKTALMREGGSIPILTAFSQILGKESLLVALASPDCRAHSPNENFPLENFFAGIRLNQALLRELAAG